MVKHENEWLDKATAASIAGAKKVALNFKGAGGVPATAQVGRLTDLQWGWIVTGAIFGWIQCRCQQAIAENVDQEEAVRSTGLSPSPCDVAVVASILPTLADSAGVDWSLPLQAWSKDTMTNFLMLAWELIRKTDAALGRGKVLQPAADWDKTGDRVRDVPFASPGVASMQSDRRASCWKDC